MHFFTVKSFLLVFFILAAGNHRAQHPVVFVPPVFNYTTHNYKAGNQNWAITQGKNGVIYIGNDYGLLSFDAVNWQLKTLPNNLSIKSLFIDRSSAEERIYAGSFEEFGYFVRDNKNLLHYHSLKPLIKDHTFYNDEVWTINKVGDLIFFQTFSSYFVYNESENTVRAFKPFPAPLYFFAVKDKLYAQFIDDHFYYFDGSEFQLLLTRDKLRNDNVVSVIPVGDELFLITSRNGIFSYNPYAQTCLARHTGIDYELRNETVNRAALLSDSAFVLGTLNNGLYALTTHGMPLWQLNRDNGLYNNTVLGLYCDEEHNLWATLDNGISLIQTNSPLSFFEPQQIRIGMAEDILVENDQLYIATNQGIYYFSEKERKASQLSDFNVQSWFIRHFDGQIITGNNTGTAFVERNRKIEIPDASTGGTDIKAGRLHNRDLLLESTYTALQIYLRNEKGKWAYSHKVSNFSDLIRQIEFDHVGNIWASHMYKGLYKLQLDEQLRNAIHQEFYPALDSAEVTGKPIRTMKLRGRIVFTNGRKFYTYNDLEQQIVLFDQLNRELPNMADTRCIVSINDTSFWFIRSEEYTLVKYVSQKYRISDRIPFGMLNNPPNSGRGNIYVDENNVSYFCLNGGVGKYVSNVVRQTKQPELLIAGIWSYNRKQDQRNNLPLNEHNTINYRENNLTFEFQFSDFSKSRFRIECFLENYDVRWIAAAPDLTVSYTNLPADSYTLKARVLNDVGEEISKLSISFEVKNPWYKTGWAIFIYCLLFVLLLVMVIRTYIRMAVKKRNKIFAEKEKERIAELDRQKKLIAEIKSEKLQNELTFKSKDLANASMLIINHQELLNKLKVEILENINTGKINRFYGTNLVKLIDSNLSGEDEWTLFQENFDLIHENFFRKLSNRYPSLTPGDLRLCALLRLNYSSKDIARTLSLTLRGVEAARYRLRKKLALNEEENLNSFFINFK